MVTRWDPFSELVTMRELANRLFNDGFARPTGAAGGQVSPFPFDLYEVGDDIVLRAGIPGVNPDEVELAVHQNVLTVKGYRNLYSGDEEKQYTWHVRGLAEGNFNLAVALPTSVDAGAAEASYDGGILTIRLPKAEAVKTRRIAIKASQPALEAAATA